MCSPARRAPASRCWWTRWPCSSASGPTAERAARRRQGDRRGRVRGPRRPDAPRRRSARASTWKTSRLVVRREISAEGRSRAWVNGSPTTAAVLARLGALLVDLHGQHETQSLLHADAQRDILDAFATRRPSGPRWPKRSTPSARSAATGGALSRRRDEVRRRADYLRHVVHEIDGRSSCPGGYGCTSEARRLGQAGTLTEQARRIAEAIDGDEADALPPWPPPTARSRRIEKRTPR